MTQPDPHADEAVPARATRREWVGLAVLALACLLYVMDLTVLHLAVPAMSADLRPSSAQLLWIIDVYGFMVAGALVTMGTLGDRIGRSPGTLSEIALAARLGKPVVLLASYPDDVVSGCRTAQSPKDAADLAFRLLPTLPTRAEAGKADL